MKLESIDSLIISLSDILYLVDTNTSDKIRDLIDVLIDKKIDIMEGWNKR